MGFGGFGMTELILIFLVVLLLFGARRLPEIGASLGKGIREFKGSIKEIEDEINAPERKESLRSGRESRPASSGEDERDGREGPRADDAGADEPTGADEKKAPRLTTDG